MIFKKLSYKINVIVYICMINYNTKKFSQIMLRNSLKHELYYLKPFIAKKIKATWNLSFSDVLDYLIDFYKKNSGSEKLPSIVVPVPKTVVRLGNIVVSQKEVIDNW